MGVVKDLKLIPEFLKRSGATIELKKLDLDMYPCIKHKGVILRPDMDSPHYESIRRHRKFSVCPICKWEVEDV